MDWISSLLPETVSPGMALLLLAASYFASATSAVFGIGGGIAMLAVMAPIVPIGALIPVHGLVQLGSNIGRAAVHWRRINRGLFAIFLAGGLVGAAIGSFALIAIPRSVHLVGLGLFVLAMVWLPLPKRGRIGRPMVAFGGLTSTFLTLFVGATGPIVMAIMSRVISERRVLVGTNAACVGAQNILKAAVFGAAGFAFAPWLPLVAAIIGCGFLGTLTGTRILHNLPERGFRIALKLLITLLSLDMLRRGFTAS